ncbi:RNA polymerase II elongation factor ELL2 [Tyto alba]|uniref:RNA polymerase II elongation factor ELL2 n=1 Tax=Tyto alba TaxID=56313 RepID=UPI001C679DBA|nr:RNA polymerase II elongation factor ELL2 [Tyto alba]
MAQAQGALQFANHVRSWPLIQFQGSQALIKIPKVDLPNEVNTFNFQLSNIGKENPQGRVDCVQQMDPSFGASQHCCLGFIQNKITVCGTGSYVTSKDHMTQTEEESRSGSAKVTRPGGPFLGRKAQVRRVPQNVPDPVPVRKRSMPMNPASTVRRVHTQSAVTQRPYRDRVIHLLALKSYKKPELLTRLQKDGVNQKDKDCLGMILQQVAILNTKDNSYSLKDYLFKDIQKDWPGYNEIDKQSLELILSRKLKPSEDATSTNHLGSSVTSNKDSPSTSQKRGLTYSFIDPLNKKRRISRLAKGVQSPLHDRLSAFREKTTVAPPPPPRPGAISIPSTHSMRRARLPTSNPPKTASSTLPSLAERCRTQNRPVDSFSLKGSQSSEDRGQNHASRSPSGVPGPAAVWGGSRKSTGKKHPALHQQHEVEERAEDEGETQHAASASGEEKDLGKETAATLNRPSCLDSDEEFEETLSASSHSLSSASEPPDYLTKYTTIVSYEQRQRYKDDFTAEYDEYRNLYAHMESISQKFVSLDAQRQLLPPGSKEYQMLCGEVLEEYQKLKEARPSYFEQKCRCKYLHSKLSHIKRLIGEFDEQQAKLQHYSPALTRTCE